MSENGKTTISVRVRIDSPLEEHRADCFYEYNGVEVSRKDSTEAAIAFAFDNAVNGCSLNKGLLRESLCECWEDFDGWVYRANAKKDCAETHVPAPTGVDVGDLAMDRTEMRSWLLALGEVCESAINAVLIDGVWYEVAKNDKGIGTFFLDPKDDPRNRTRFVFLIADTDSWGGQCMLGPLGAISAIRVTPAPADSA